MSQNSFTTPVYICEFCRKTYGSKRSLIRHQANCGPIEQCFSCDQCLKTFKRQDYLKLHKKTYHLNDRDSLTCQTCSLVLSSFDRYRKHISTCQASYIQASTSSNLSFTCRACEKQFPSIKALTTHTQHKHLKCPTQQDGGGRGEPKPKRSNRQSNGCSRQAINGQVREFDFVLRGQEGADPMFYLMKIQFEIIRLLENEIESKHSIKWGICTQFKFSKIGPDGQKTFTEPYFRTKMTPATVADDLELAYAQAVHKIMIDMDNFEGDSSNLDFEEVLTVKLTVTMFQPFRGSAYFPLPPKLRKKKCLLNIRNIDDHKCFIYAILAHLHPSFTSHKDLPDDHIQHLPELQLDGCKFPHALKDINKFEKKNDLSINVYGYHEKLEKAEENVIFPLKISDNVSRVDPKRHIDLLFLNSDQTSHYVLITSLAGLVRRPGDSNSKHICRKCLWIFTSEDCRLKHVPYCYHKAQRIKMPEPDKTTRQFGLGHMSKTVRIPFVIFSNFECILSPVEEDDTADGLTHRIQHHEPCSYSYQIVCREPRLYSYDLKTFSGEHAAHYFMESILADYQEINKILEDPVPVRLTQWDKQLIDCTTVCYLCGDEIEHDRHIDHDHLTGEFRGVCHSYCNVNYQECKFVPVVCHNASRYDNHLILQAAELFAGSQLKCIPHNSEHFLMFEIDGLRFLDSYKFLNTSLQTLATNLKSRGRDQFRYLRGHFPDHVDLLTRKLPYFYEYVDSFEKLEETVFPTRDEFYSSLTEETVTEEDYLFARGIWDTFHCRSVRDFMELYVSVDTLILTDVMEAFRSMCLQYYQLDPLHYYTLPGMAMDACLKMTDVSLDLFTDPDMYNFIEQGIRGGVASINHREFVGLRAKNYSYIVDKTEGITKEELRAKGIQKTFIRKHLRHEMFKDCLLKHKQTTASYHQIRSFHNELFTIKTTKIALTPLDDKRYLLDDGIESKPYGYNPL
ncbi:uncharacterized protein LOC121369418 [Gigantopelta aegis]|uniref:uncharacterized protein LOC121369418 n=1 Tax=Gigantopelta aegis TaxID=1735272 RepID=UPI001B88D0B0|nr:uncharacterized protein LOC121369418 [Gigantopelta aegis]